MTRATRKSFLGTALALIPMVGLAFGAPAHADAALPGKEEQESEQVEADPEIAADVQALDISDEALSEDANKFIEAHSRGQNTAAAETLAKRIEATDPEQVLQVLEELRKEGVKAESSPDFAQRYAKKLEGLPAASAPVTSEDVETTALGPAEKNSVLLLRITAPRRLLSLKSLSVARSVMERCTTGRETLSSTPTGARSWRST